MEIKEFIQNFADQFEDTNVKKFTAETKFKELEEWSSLISLSLIAMVDEEYDVTLMGADIKSANTIQDLYNIICSKK